MRDTQDIIVQLLRNIGTRKEVEQYLRQFTNVDSKRFAIIKVGGNVIAKELEGLASSLTFLHKVGLYPIVIHGAGPQLDEELDKAGVVTPRIGGLRVTPPEALDIARKVFRRENLKLVEALEELGTRARPITSGVFEAEAVDRDRLGLVGSVRTVHLEAIEASIRAGHLPILASLGETASGQILNINADVAAGALARALLPFKIVFLTETGGLLDDKGEILSAINLAEDYDALMQKPWVHSGMRLKLQQIKELLDALPATSSVSITTPDHLAKELFTHKGSGTLVRQGERVERHDGLEGIDLARLRALVEEGFQRSLKDDYFNVKEFFRIYLGTSYRATAILTREPGIEVPYLDKFAVTQEAQGLGLGGSIWERMRRENPRLYWRSRRDNPINAWYFEHADGSWKTDKWIVFWYGIEEGLPRDVGWERVRACIEQALSVPASLGDPSAAPRRMIEPRPLEASEPEDGHGRI